MGKEFNVTGACNLECHYMVNIQDRLKEIKKLVDNGAYFTINRARQYGKTTTLTSLKKYLEEAYVVVYLDFQRLSYGNFKDEETFVCAFSREFIRILKKIDIHEDIIKRLEKIAYQQGDYADMQNLFTILSDWCAISEKPIVLIIDEVDSAANNQIFMDFLAQLRWFYLNRNDEATFQSVILAGVYDIKNIRQKLRSDEEHKYNSPWNIATTFNVDMSFNPEDISGMLSEYEQDHHTGMNITEMAENIYEYTSGYPFLVSRICQILDKEVSQLEEYTDLSQVWTYAGFVEAIKIIISEKNSLFESLVNKLIDHEELRQIVYSMLFNGKEVPYNALNRTIENAEAFGFIKNNHNKLAISNRIFETVLYNYFISEEVINSEIYDEALNYKSQFIEQGKLNMTRVLEKFVETFDYLYGDEDEKFIEDVGRRYFMLFIKPIINGVGNCYVEAQTRNKKRTDIIIDYRQEQFIVELKIWGGVAYNESGEQQISEYLDYYNLKKGYMLTFNFNKKKKIGVKEIQIGDKILVEAVV